MRCGKNTAAWRWWPRKPVSKRNTSRHRPDQNRPIGAVFALPCIRSPPKLSRRTSPCLKGFWGLGAFCKKPPHRPPVLPSVALAPPCIHSPPAALPHNIPLCPKGFGGLGAFCKKPPHRPPVLPSAALAPPCIRSARGRAAKRQACVWQACPFFWFFPFFARLIPARKRRYRGGSTSPSSPSGRHGRHAR